jgi:DNA-binding CsgD family transcriptional regulator
VLLRLFSLVSFTLVRGSHCAPVHEVVEKPAAHPKLPNLTDRELHIFALSGAGFGTSGIARELGISPRTVETYHEHIKIKLGYPDADALHRGAREWFELSHRKQLRENAYSSSWITRSKYQGESPIDNQVRDSLLSRPISEDR